MDWSAKRPPETFQPVPSRSAFTPHPNFVRIYSQATFQNGRSRVHPRTDAIAELVGEDGVGALDRPTGRLFRLRRRKDTPSPVQRTGLENRRQRLLGQWAGKGHRRRLRSVSRDGYMPESGSIPPLPTRAILEPRYSICGWWSGNRLEPCT